MNTLDQFITDSTPASRTISHNEIIVAFAPLAGEGWTVKYIDRDLFVSRYTEETGSDLNVFPPGDTEVTWHHQVLEEGWQIEFCPSLAGRSPEGWSRPVDGACADKTLTLLGVTPVRVEIPETLRAEVRERLLGRSRQVGRAGWGVPGQAVFLVTRYEDYGKNLVGIFTDRTLADRAAGECGGEVIEVPLDHRLAENKEISLYRE